MDERPILLPEGLDAIGGDHTAGIAVIRPKADHPRIAHFCERWIGAAEAKRLGGLEDVIGDRVVFPKRRRIC